MIAELIAAGVGLYLISVSKPENNLRPAISPDARINLVDRGTLVGRYLDVRTPSHLHRGIDIAAPRHSNIHNIQDGKVIGIYPEGERQGYGNSILVLHSDGFSSFYAHLENFNPSLARGSDVYRGQILGSVGSSGIINDHAHLHLEILKGLRFFQEHPAINEDRPERINPLDYLIRHNVTIGRA